MSLGKTYYPLNTGSTQDDGTWSLSNLTLLLMLLAYGSYLLYAGLIILQEHTFIWQASR